MFTNAKQSIPKCFEDKMKADSEWKEFASATVVHCGKNMMTARQFRANVLRARDSCAQFIRNAMKP